MKKQISVLRNFKPFIFLTFLFLLTACSIGVLEVGIEPSPLPTLTPSIPDQAATATIAAMTTKVARLTTQVAAMSSVSTTLSPATQPVAMIQPGESVVLTFAFGLSPEKARQLVTIQADRPGQYSLVLENANPTWSKHWIIWDYLSLKKRNALIWEIGEDETPPDYSDEAFAEFCDPQPPRLQNCSTEFVVGLNKPGDFSKELNDGGFPLVKINFNLTEQQVAPDLTLTLSTLYSTHKDSDNFEMRVTLLHQEMQQ